MGSPGMVDPSSGAIVIAPNIAALDSLAGRAALRARLGVDCAIENDVNLAAVGEHWRGSSRKAQNFAFIAVGTGIGMGIFADGQLVRGARGAAGEIAYLPLGGDPYDARGLRLSTSSIVFCPGVCTSSGLPSPSAAKSSTNPSFDVAFSIFAA